MTKREKERGEEVLKDSSTGISSSNEFCKKTGKKKEKERRTKRGEREGRKKRITSVLGDRARAKNRISGDVKRRVSARRLAAPRSR